MPEPQEISIGLNLDTTGFQQQLGEAETLMQQGVQRMTALQVGDTPTVVSTPAGAPPPLPPPSPPPSPPPISTPGAPRTDPIVAAWEELEQIKAMAGSAPDVAMAALRGGGNGGLQARVLRGAATDPENAEQYQALISALKDLTKTVQEEVKSAEDGGNGGIMKMIRQNAMFQVGQMVTQNAMGGNVLGAGGTLIGGLVGGPAGAMVGSTIGTAVGGFLNKAGEANDYASLTSDIAARFGNFGQEETLSAKKMADRDLSGYTPQQAAELADLLRQSHAVTQLDEQAMEIVRSLQELSRATGENSQLLAQNYASYKTMGGGGTPETYMGQMLAGAVSAGMRENLSQYMDLVGSARSGLVYRTFQADEGGAGMKSVQSLLNSLTGTDSRTSQLLKDNPVLAQQLTTGFLATGSAQSHFGYDAAALRLAGGNVAGMVAGYAMPEDIAQNAILRHEHAFRNFYGQSLKTMGFDSMEQLQSAARSNPNLVQDLLSSRNPNSEQAAMLQQGLDVQLQAVLGRDATAEDRTRAMQLMQTQLATGSLTLQTKTQDGKVLADVLGASKETDAEKYRQAQEDLSKSMLLLYDSFKQYQPELTRLSADLIRFLGENAPKITESIDSLTDWLSTNGPAIGQALTATANGINTLAGFLGGPLLPGSAGGQTSPTVNAGSKIGETVGGGLFGPAGAVVGSKVGTTVGEMLNNASDEAKSGLAGFVQGINPKSLGLNSSEVHAEYNDTPPGGVLAGPEFNTFQFAPGDVVHASQGGSSSHSAMPPAINIYLTVPANADSEWMRGAAREGTQSGLDEFMEQWDAGRLQRRNHPRIINRLY